jgi:hypothetical protein
MQYTLLTLYGNQLVIGPEYGTCGPEMYVTGYGVWWASCRNVIDSSYEEDQYRNNKRHWDIPTFYKKQQS